MKITTSILNAIRRLLLIGVGACFVIGLSIDVNASVGDLDPTFGGGAGKLLLTSAGTIEHQTASLMQQDDKLLVVGSCSTAMIGGTVSKCISRYLANGELDLAFASSGVFSLESAACVGAGALRILGDGKLLVSGSFVEAVSAGFYQSGLCAMRLTRGGMLDSGFGDGGITRMVVPGARFVETTDLRVAPSGTITIAASCTFLLSPPQVNSTNFCVTQLHSDGLVDNSFGVSGVLVHDSLQNTNLSTLTQTADALYFTGWCWNKTGVVVFRLCVTKTNPGGVVDTSWATQGTYEALLSGATSCQANELIVDADAAVLIAASCDTLTSRRGNVIRLLANGSLDLSFGVGGIATDWGTHAFSGFGSILKNQYGSTTFLSGRCGESLTSNSPCIWRFAASGAADSSFGVNGVVKVAFPPTTRSFARYAINQQKNGKLVFAMSCALLNSPDEDFCLGRLLDKAGYFDLDSNNEVESASDASLYIRHLFGFRDTALTSGALGTYADRTAGADIETYLSTPNATYPNCSASIVGAPGGPNAMLDGIVLMRAMLGLSGDAVTNGIVFPAGTTRTAWADIKTHLSTNCGMALN